MQREYDVIVVGGGHAGVEAANAAARMGVRTVLVTSVLETIGQMSCNPAIGGVAKGTVVREVDALGGIMGRAADRATIQFRMLNRSKGPAVWSPRAQCDRGLYRRAVRALLEERRGLDIVQGTVAGVGLRGHHAGWIDLEDGTRLQAPSIVITAGTFLRGRIHMGGSAGVAGGRAGDAAVTEIAECLEDLGLRVGRFKTGTPPRIDGRSVDYSQLERQPGEDPEYRFSRFERRERPPQLPCWITWAGEAVKEIIHRDLAKSALYGGEISGRGPRYCPSIEDKVLKFPDAQRHQIFLEPEGLDTSELYVNGLSTSLPVDTQVEFLQAVPGLSAVKMTRPGYAIEYDYYPPEQLNAGLEVKAVGGLFFAGQINGTTGYEEAAGQGVLAGINAARRARGEELVVVPRNQGYIGVLVDDLVTKGVDEPYRLFTSRSEYRLLLRQDNALGRYFGLAEQLDLLTEAEVEVARAQVEGERELVKGATEGSIAADAVNRYLEEVDEAPVAEKLRVAELVRRPGARLRPLMELAGLNPEAPADSWATAEIELKYEGYLARERRDAERMREMADFRLPSDLEYANLLSLSYEARQKLETVRPTSLAQAGRIPGVSPSDLQNLVLAVARGRSTA